MSAVGQAARVRVRVRVWGLTDADVVTAERRAARGWGRNGWEFGEVERTVGGVCPLDVRDPGAVAAGADFGWAYTVHRTAP